MSRHVISTNTAMEQGQQAAKSTMSLGTIKKCRHTVCHLFVLLIQYLNSRVLAFRKIGINNSIHTPLDGSGLFSRLNFKYAYDY